MNRKIQNILQNDAKSVRNKIYIFYRISDENIDQ